MKYKRRNITIVFFALLLILLLSSKTVLNVCEVCGVQEYERSLFGTPIELISKREVDEFGTHKKWKQEHGEPHYPHQFKEVKVPTRDLLKN